MPIPRPKILTRVTLPSALTFDVTVTDSTQFDTTVQPTIPAGDYYIAFDWQSDDLCAAVAEAIHDAIVAASATFTSANASIACGVDSNHKFWIQFGGSVFVGARADVRIDWNSGAGGDESTVAALLGFDPSADDSSTSVDRARITADFEHPYGWYANEDGQLESLSVEEVNVATSSQATALTGETKTVLLGSRYVAEMALQFIPRDRMFSAGVAYESAPTYPYERNRGLECWWLEARKGTPFRVYRDSKSELVDATQQGRTMNSATSTTFQDSDLTFDTEPFRYVGYAVNAETQDALTTEVRARGRIESHTSNVFTLNESRSFAAWDAFAPGADSDYWLTDDRHQTFVLDIDGMSEFRPEEIPQIDRYNLTIPLKRHV